MMFFKLIFPSNALISSKSCVVNNTEGKLEDLRVADFPVYASFVSFGKRFSPVASNELSDDFFECVSNRLCEEPRSARPPTEESGACCKESGACCKGFDITNPGGG